MKKVKEFRLSQEVRNKLKDKELIKKELLAGKAPQEVLGFSLETMAKFYQAALHLFEGHRYVDASHAFLFLVTLNSFNYDYWIGLGMSTQLINNFEAAIDAYEMAAICEMENPVPYFYLAKCLFAIHDRESALQAIDMALEYADEKEEYANLKAQAEAARILLLNTDFH